MNNELSPIKIEYEPRLATLEQYEIQSQAVDIAGLCARMLKREFAVEKVILFGSMIYPEDIVYWTLDKQQNDSRWKFAHLDSIAS